MKELLVQAFREVLRSLDFEAAVREGIARLPDAPPRRVLAVAIGKAAPAMMAGALASPWNIERALVVCPDGTPCELAAGPHLQVLRASHPLPDARSVEAGARILQLAESTTAEDLLLVMVSGGASALACAPHPGIDFAMKLDVTHALLRAGASIVEFNTVRRHLSRLKGGGLTRAARGPVVAFLASDVIGGKAHDIGSGPTAPDPTSVDDARAVLQRYAPQFASLELVPSLAASDEAAARERHFIVIEPELLAERGARALERAGWSAKVLPPSMAPVSELADDYARLARSLAPGQAVVRVAEPSLEVDPATAGRGGRSGHLAAVIAPRLPRDVAFLAGASDGADGTSSAAGAVVDAAWAAAVDPSRRAEHIARFDTAALHAGTGSAIVTGPSGVNLCDLHLLVRATTSSGAA
ncbi:glycerate kinase [Pendulispora rubella]|uniref:Glycerate kinase n=1 Tax=Pendulispora rubella TaxID=2741070 RepID=A0ABZ2L9X1_9BACT